MYEAVLFDLDNTFYAYAPCHAEGLKGAWEYFRQFGFTWDFEKFSASYQLHRGALQKRLGETAAAHNRLLYFQNLVEEALKLSHSGLALDLEEAYWKQYFAQMAKELDPFAKELLLELREQKVSLALVTDLTAEIQLKKLRYLSLEQCFDCMVSSEEAGADKPDPAALRLALEKLGRPAAQAVMIGDSIEKDFSAAQRLGLPFIHVQRSVEESSRQGFRVADFKGLRDLLLAKP